jgi:hypothetical protein
MMGMFLARVIDEKLLEFDAPLLMAFLRVNCSSQILKLN